MAEETKIEWCHHSYNPWRGCSRVSPGCTNCYAETMSGRNPSTLGVWGPNGTRVVASESMWREPLKWDRKAKEAGERRRVFCSSLADVFEDWNGKVTASNGNPLWWCHGSLSNSPIPSTGLENGCRLATMDDIRGRLFDLVEQTPNLDWLLLTKRPENFWDMLPSEWYGNREGVHRMPSNVWLGVSVEDQKRADERIPLLLQVPAVVRFLSVEPLLGPVEFSDVTNRPDAVLQLGKKSLTGINWVIIGGESGGGARKCDVVWVRSIVQQCKAAGVACFTKQLGANVNTGPHDAEEGEFPRCWRCGHFDFGPCSDGTLLCNGCNAVWDRLRHKKGGDMAEWPVDLRVREFPEVRQS